MRTTALPHVFLEPRSAKPCGNASKPLYSATPRTQPLWIVLRSRRKNALVDFVIHDTADLSLGEHLEQRSPRLWHLVRLVFEIRAL